MARNTTAPAAVRCVDLTAPILKELSIYRMPMPKAGHPSFLPFADVIGQSGLEFSLVPGASVISSIIS